MASCCLPNSALYIQARALHILDHLLIAQHTHLERQIRERGWLALSSSGSCAPLLLHLLWSRLPTIIVLVSMRGRRRQYVMGSMSRPANTAARRRRGCLRASTWCPKGRDLPIFPTTRTTDTNMDLKLHGCAHAVCRFHIYTYEIEASSATPLLLNCHKLMDASALIRVKPAHSYAAYRINEIRFILFAYDLL